MKRIFIAVFLIISSAFIGIYGSFETKRTCEAIVIEIEEATKENKNISENSGHVKRINFYNTTLELKALWEENSDFFYFFFNNDDIKAIEINIEKLPEHAKNGDLESAYLCLIECKEELVYLKNNTELTFSNIF